MRVLRSFAVVGVLAAGIAISGGAFGDQIKAISSDQLATTFTNSGGTFSLGVLTVADCAPIVVQYPLPTGQVTYNNGHVNITTSLFQDCSTGGLAFGIFKGGSFTLKDSSNADLLDGNISEIDVIGLTGQLDTLAGTGAFTVTGGSLQSDFGGTGSFFDLFFNISPGGIQNFSAGWTGQAKVNLTPTPEPTTCLLFGTAGLTLIGWMRRKRMN